MVAKTTQQIEKTVRLDDELVSQYLSDNPDFFVNHSELAEKIKVPHPVQGAVSLLEWKMAKQSEKISQLQAEITLLMEHASTNQILIEKLILLKSQLLTTPKLTDIVISLDTWAKSLGLMGASLYLFEDKWELNSSLMEQSFALSADKFDVIRVKYLQFSKQYLGTVNRAELELLLPKLKKVGSVALSLLGERGELGVVAFSSRDPLHYQTGQGTLMLEKITEILLLVISQSVKRKS